MKPTVVFGLSGSLRTGSYNTALLQACQEFFPADFDFQIADLAGLPIFSEDIVAFPAGVQTLRDAAARADAFLFATPEYNHSISGCMKNALDWLSRPPQPPCVHKPAAIIGASTGAYGTARAQTHLRAIASFMNMFVVNRPEVMVPFAQHKFDSEGKLIDADARKFLGQLIAELVKMIEATQALREDRGKP